MKRRLSRKGVFCRFVGLIRDKYNQIIRASPFPGTGGSYATKNLIIFIS